VTFQKATRRRARLRMALMGPTGAGKTFSALAIGSHLGKKMAVIDTEHGSASEYAEQFSFDVTELANYDPLHYTAKLKQAADAGYDVVVIDSLSHAWMGIGGALEQVDDAAAASKGNTYVAWRKVTPKHNALVQAIISYPGHVIATMRSKMDYAQETDSNGRKVIRKIGMAPIQRENMEYEFTVVGDMDLDHRLVVTKTRIAALDGKVFHKPAKDFADVVNAWYESATEEVVHTGHPLIPPGGFGSVEQAKAILPMFKDNIEPWYDAVRAEFKGEDDLAFLRAAVRELKDGRP
jgi:hypothetical protein